MVKLICEVNLWCVPIAQITDGAMKNKPIFRLNSGSSTYYSVKGLLNPIILNTT